MGIWAGIKGFFTSSDNLTASAANVIDTGASMVDNAFFTDQEKSVASEKLFDMWLRYQDTVNQQSSPTARSRRYVAWGVVSLVWIACILCFGLIIFELDADGEKQLAIIEVLRALWIGPAFTAAIGFYFTPHVFKALAGMKK